jgi:hypothetical protein
MGIDPAYGSSAFGIVVTQWEDNHIQIMHVEEYHRPDYNEMLSVVYGLMSKYQVDKVYIDGANPSFIKSLKLQIGEDSDYDKVIAKYRSEKMSDDWSQDMKIVPVNFNAEHSEYGNFVANFRQAPSPIPPEYLIVIFGFILSTIVPSILRWMSGYNQRRNLYKYLVDEIDTDHDNLDKSSIILLSYVSIFPFYLLVQFHL